MITRDCISDMISIIRNGVKANLDFVNILYTKLNIQVLKILYKEYLINNFKILFKLTKKKKILIKYIQVELHHGNDEYSNLFEFKKISTPGNKIYYSVKQLFFKYYRKDFFAIISTNKGLLTVDEAIKLNIGGEILISNKI